MLACRGYFHNTYFSYKCEPNTFQWKPVLWGYVWYIERLIFLALPALCVCWTTGDVDIFLRLNHDMHGKWLMGIFLSSVSKYISAQVIRMLCNCSMKCMCPCDIALGVILLWQVTQHYTHRYSSANPNVYIFVIELFKDCKLWNDSGYRLTTYVYIHHRRWLSLFMMFGCVIIGT